ncbi:enoyl-CoA hydratase-related protein [Pseudomonas jinjuensis]|uniref:Enoyl-CoA hydratase/carnithine racemase n=1 Tax=Pseudomonas jinjuensis TaxID=198616 RepID=A0A1H0Q1W9_9PSED|nr:enoyl-CoA hydratase-related protein [Pseudomonas jinjuensis]SDP11363.1 Enoyl-CoA hydratase/carnithine racemase [Pseudomonas jinjuensis]
MSEHILVEREQGLLTLRLNRLDKKNALTAAMYAALADALEAAEQDAGVRVVMIAGSADCFTAGNDIVDFLERPPTGPESPVFRFMRALLEFSKPVVAAVAGPAVGIGTTLLLHCDLVYVSRDARLKMPFVNLALCPEFGSSFLLPRLLGHAHAARLLLQGEGFDGEQAAAWGIAGEALADGEATLERARETALGLLELAQSSLVDSKRLMKSGYIEKLRRVVREEGDLFVQRLPLPEAVEALSAFTQRRKPDFSPFN